MAPPRDIISITGLSLRSSYLPLDLWQRPSKSQPLLCNVSIATSITSEASTDSLLTDSLNYGTVTKAIEKAVAELKPEEGDLALEVLAELLARTIIFKASAPNVRLELYRPRALLSAESVGVEIYRQASDYLPPKSASPVDRDLDPKSTSPFGDKLVVKSLRRLIVIGLNACERLDEQEVIVDLEFGADEMILPYAGLAREGWKGWKGVVKQVEENLTSSRPLTIEAIVTSLATIILTPPTSTLHSPQWNVSSTMVRIAKPHALMFARYPSVQVTRQRSDFFDTSGALLSSLAGSLSHSIASSSSGAGPSEGSTVGTEVDASPAGGRALHSVVVGVGSNMGERMGHISRALKELERAGSVGGEKTSVVETSWLYESQAMYVVDQAPFLNGAAKIETTLDPTQLLSVMKATEELLGREKTFKNGPRVIDLDILYYDQLEYDSRNEVGGEPDRWLKIPHASIAEREFVLRPLVDLIPNFVHPTLQASSKSLLSTLLITIPTSLDRVLPLSPTVCHSLHSRTLVMSILNTTPDSFSDGGDHFSLPDALASALAHIKAGADILDIGGMSTRPGADDVDPEIEISRVIPLIRALRERGIVTPISVDTFRPAVARAAIEAGANIVNDVLGGSTEGMLEAMAELDVPVVLMHSRGTPATMSSMTTYEGGVIAGVQRELGARVEAALAKGVKRWNIILDPGVGFAKAGPDNLVLLRELPALLAGAELAGYPSLVGLSRKKFLGTLTGKSDAKERIWGTAGGVTASIVGGADIVRVHDVKEMVDVVRVADGIYRPIVSKKM